MSREALFILGSPSVSSKSRLVAGAVGRELLGAGFEPVTWSLADFDASDLLFGRTQSPTVARFLEATRRAAAIVLATPVYKAAYAGALKTMVDLVSPDAWVGRPALGIATVKLAAHGSDVDRAFRSLFAFFKTRTPDTLVVLDDELSSAEVHGALSVDVDIRVKRAAKGLERLNEVKPL
jgi:FMN reductase